MIEFRAFTKIYGGRTVVDHLSLLVPKGSAVALLGPNGSGKTTSIKAAAGLIRPDFGEVRLGAEARPATDPRARQRSSFLPQRVSFPDALTGREVVEFYRRLRGAPPAAADRVLRFASLNGSSTRAVGTYSGGMVQRLGLAVAALAEGDALLLDEPTAALDPEGLEAFYKLIDERRSQGGTTLFSSHQLGDIERLADRIAVIVGGRMVAELSARDIAALLADRGVMRVKVTRWDPRLLDCVRRTSPDARWTGDELVVPGPVSSRPAVLDMIRSAGIDISSLTTEEGRLDHFYRDLVGGAQ